MTHDLTQTHLEWRQLPLIIITGLIIGLLFGQAAALLAQSDYAKPMNPKLQRAAKRVG